MWVCRKTILFFLLPSKVFNLLSEFSQAYKTADFSKVYKRTEISRKDCFKILIKCLSQVDKGKRLI